MLSVAYDNIFSRFLGQVQAYDLIVDDEDVAKAKLNEWLRSIKSNPRVRKSFTTLSFDDENQEINFTLRVPEDDESDMDFVIEVFALGVKWKWSAEKYNSVLNTAQYFGSGEKKMYSQAQHMDKLHEMSDTAKKEFFGIIRDRASYKNNYLEEA